MLAVAAVDFVVFVTAVAAAELVDFEFVVAVDLVAVVVAVEALVAAVVVAAAAIPIRFYFSGYRYSCRSIEVSHRTWINMS